MKLTREVIDALFAEHPRTALAYSGGSDSNVLLDFVFTRTPYRPPVVFTDTQLEYPETLDYIRARCATYGAELHVARAKETPAERWEKTGWPFFGKMAARQFMQKNRDLGIKCDVSSCCRALKIAPARRLVRQLGCTAHMTGQRGAADDQLRGLRTIRDGATHYVKADGIVVCSPLTGWTDTMIRRYTRKADIPPHPAKDRGAVTIGCVVCGGGAQFADGGWRILRRTWPEGWYQFFVRDRAGLAVIAAKYRVPLARAREAVNRLGGLDTIARERPWVFDYLQYPPRRATYAR